MSLGIVLQEKDRIVVGGDTALSANINGKFKRVGEIKKVFKFGNDAVFLTGISNYVHIVYTYLDSQHDKYIDIKKLQHFLRQLPKANDLYCKDISIIISRVIDSKSYAYLLISENNYEIQESVVDSKGFRILAAGINIEEAKNIMIALLQQGVDVVTSYNQCYKKLSCQTIGGDINLLMIDNDGIHDLANICIDNINRDSTFKESKSNNKYCIIGDALIGQMVMSEKLQIRNQSGTYVINDNGFKMSNGDRYIMLDPSKPSILAWDGEKNALDFNSDGEGTLTIRGDIEGSTINGSKIKSCEIEIGDGNFVVDKDGKMTCKVGTVDINTEYGSDNIIALNYDVSQGNEDNLNKTTSEMKQDYIGIKRDFLFNGNLENASIHLNMNYFEPSLCAKTIVPKDGSFQNYEVFEGKISLSGAYVIADNDTPANHYPLFKSDVPFYSTNVKSGSITKEITAINTRFTVDVEFTNSMHSTPSVVVTPVTTNPSAVSVSVANITNTGFTIYMYRTDTTGNLGVNWIAMC